MLTESEKEEITTKLFKLAGVPQNRIEEWRRKWRMTDFNSLGRDTHAYCPLCGKKNSTVKHPSFYYDGYQNHRIFDFHCTYCHRNISFQVVGV